ncbi:MAG: hypothetical protein KC466_02515, partial [Myxococcales bacterium]|nr:hypothetical protein [Myxococcales bacterium]
MRRLIDTIAAIPLAGHAAALAAGFGLLAAAGDLSRHVGLYLTVHGVLSIVCLHAATRAEARGLVARPRWILAAALLFRVMQIPAAPSLSDDLWRYLWDGRVSEAGINPFAHAPDARALAALRDGDWAKINHREIPTIYPPLAQFAFRAARGIGSGSAALKSLWVLCDLGVMAVLVALLARSRRPASRLILYAWNPLVVVEVARAGHVDVLGILFVTLALWAVAAGRERAGVAAVSLAGLAKLIPFGLLLWFLPRRPRATAALAATLVAVGYLPFLGAGSTLFAGLAAYGEHWRFHPLGFGLLAAWVSDPRAARLLALALWLGATGVTVLRGATFERAAFVFFGGYLLLSPTLHPWYFLWILPFAALRRSRAWWLAAALAPLGYGVLARYRDGGPWREIPWVP